MEWSRIWCLRWLPHHLTFWAVPELLWMSAMCGNTPSLWVSIETVNFSGFFTKGGGALDPQFDKYVPRRSEKCGALEHITLCSGVACAWKCWSLVRVRARAWKGLLWGWFVAGNNPRSTRRTFRIRAGRSKPAVGRRRNGLKIGNFENDGLWSAAKTLKWWCSGADFSVICKNDMLWSGNLGLKMGVSKMAHTQYAYGSAPRGLTCS